MINIVFRDLAGLEKVVTTRPGLTLMDAAKDGDVDGIVAECGGACSCATCHVHVDETWWERLPEMDPIEKAMLSYVDSREITSRLSCQIDLDESMDGLLVTVARDN